MREAWEAVIFDKHFLSGGLDFLGGLWSKVKT